MNKQIIFVDSSVANYQTLIQNADLNAQIVILDANKNGIEQITEALAQQTEITSIHIISHGSSGSLQLGNTTLNNSNLNTYSSEVEKWRNALTENADILLYGCDVAAGESGLNFVQNLSEIVGADIAASDDKTGNQTLGGDWDLEVKFGNIETNVAVSSQAQTTYGDILGIQLVKDINPGSASSFPTFFATVNNTLLFNADDGVNGIELWKTDGTSSGTVFVKDIYPGFGGSNFRLTSVGNIAYFSPNDPTTPYELWRTDGTSGGTFLVKDINPSGFGSPYQFTSVSGTTLFVASDSTNGAELWKTDGTNGGTVLVKDVYPGSTGGLSSFSYLTNVNNTLYFAGGNPFTGYDLWKSDGTNAGTVAVKAGITPQYLTNVNGTLYFVGYDTNGGELWKSDGTEAGTVLVQDIYPGSNNSSITFLTNINNTLYFWANNGTNGVELWKTDGTAAGTVLVKDINPGSGGSQGYTTFANVNNTLFFTASNGTNGVELWKTDGTEAGTVLVKDINPGITSSSIYELTNFNGTLYFHTSDGVNGFELWKSDGTEAGTKMVKDLMPGAGSPNIADLTVFNNALYFRADNGTNGNELYKLTASSVTAVTATTANGAYGVGQTINITVTFNEAVTVDTAGGTPRVQLATGTTNQYATYASGSGTSTLTFSYTVQPGDTAADLEYLATNSLQLNGGSIAADGIDAVLTLPALGTAQSLGGSKNIAIDTVVPTVTNITSTTPDSSYAVGQVIPITVQFSEIVTVTGTPQLTLATGGAGTVLNYASGSGTNTLTFNYTVAAGDTSADLDYLSTAALALNGGTIKDSASNDAILTLPPPGAANSLGANKAIVIDSIVPSIANITSSTADGSYTVGQVIPITVEFSEIVSVTSTPQLTLATGGAGTVLNYASGSGTNTLTFNYTVAAGDTSADLDYLSTAAFSLNGGTIADGANNNANLTLPAPGATNSLSANKGLVIDAIVPTVTNITSTTTDGSYTIGQVIPITVEFSEIVSVTGTPQLTLATGGAGTVLNYASGSGTNTLTFNYTVAAGHTSADLDYLSTAALALNGGTITDGNNDANLTLPAPAAANSLSANKALVIDAIVPTVTNITSTTADGSYTVGQVIPITVEFSEIVSVTGTPQLTLATGGAGTVLNYASGSGTNTLTFNYTVAAGHTSADLDYLSTAALSLNGGTITDSAGNNATLALPTPAGANSLAANKNIAVDTAPLTVTINQDAGQTDPTAGATINFAVTFSKPVTGFDSSDVAIGGTAGATSAAVTPVGNLGTTYNVAVTGMSAIGTVTASINAGGATDVAGNSNTASTSTDNQVNYNNTSPTIAGINRTDPNITNASAANYTVSFSENVTGVDASDFTLATTGGVTGASIVSVIPINGSSYTVSANTGSGDGTLQLNFTDDDSVLNGLSVPVAGAGANNGNATGQIYTIDKTLPALSNITSTNADGTYGTGQAIAIALTFSEVVRVTGTPRLTLNNGGFATYAAGTGTNSLTFNYSVAAGQTTADLDYASTTALELNGGSIADLAANNANLTLAAPGAAGSLGANKNLVIDATAATVANITSILADGNYTTGQVAPVTVTFSENVSVTGTPVLTLNNGGTATYAAGSGTNTLTFNYSVAAGQNTPDLDQASASALSLNGGTIRDQANNNANLAVPAPGAANSLGANKNIAIDTTAPTISNVSSTLSDGSYTTGQVIPIAIAFSKNVSVTGTPRLALNNGTQANYISGSGTNTLTFNYTVAAGQNIADLDYANALALSLSGGTIKDVFNNNATLTLPAPGATNSLGANKNIAIDTTVPRIASVNSTLANGSYTVGQVVPITVNFNESVNVTGSPTLALNTNSNATYVSGSGTNNLIFNYTVAAGQNAADLDYASATALALNGGTIADLAANNAALNLAVPGALNSLGANKNIAIDTTAPAISTVTSTLPNGSYPIGTVIPITIGLNENVNVTGTPTLALNNGGNATNTAGSGTNNLTFNYTVGAGQNTPDLDYASINALLLSLGSLRDAAGNNSTLTLPAPGAANSLGANKNIAIDATVPTISNVTATIPNGNYTVGQVVPIAIAFSEPITVTGTPTLALNNGGVASYIYGSGTNTLTFNYTVAAGQNTADLDYASVNALALNSGTIKDAVGNNAVLTLPAPGAANSIGANNNIVIDTAIPRISNVISPAADASYLPGQVIAIDVFFDKNVSVTGTPKLSLNSGGTANYVGKSGSNSLRFDYTIAEGHKTPDLDYTSANALSLNGGTIEDAFNNNALLNLPAPGTPNSLGGNKNISIFNANLGEPETGVNANIRLDGVDDYVQIAGESTFDLTNAITVEGWFKVDSWTKPWQSIITKGNNAWRISRAGEGNGLEFAIDRGETGLFVQGTKAVNDGRWHHVAAVYDGFTMKLYIDGVLDGQRATNDRIATNNFDVWIGANAAEPGRNFAGQLDEFRVWNVARSENDIKANMKRSIDENSLGLLAYWKFDESAGTTIVDASGGDNNGTLANSSGSSWQEDLSPVESTDPNAPPDNNGNPDSPDGEDEDDGIKFATWNQLDSFVNQLYQQNPLGPITKLALKSAFDVFELGEIDPNNTITATGEFSSKEIELTSEKDEIRIDLATLVEAVAKFHNVPIPVPTALLKEYGITLPLSEATLSISELRSAPIYELSAKVKIPDHLLNGDNQILKWIKDLTKQGEFTLKAEVNSAITGPSLTLTGSFDFTQDVTLLKVDTFEIAVAGNDLAIALETGGPSITNALKLKLKNYDPFQEEEPDLNLTGVITVEAESFSGGFQLGAESAWKNPFGLPDSEFRNVVFEAGGSYIKPYFDNYKFLGDLKFGNYNIKAGYAVDVNDTKNNAVLLTVNDPLSFLDLYIGPIRSFGLKQVADRVGFIQDGVKLLDSIFDLRVGSYDSDKDGDVDPLVKVALFPTSIGDEVIQPGLSVNGKLTAWGKEATLMFEGNPFNPENPSLRGALNIEKIDWGFFKLGGASQPNLSVDFSASPSGIYLGANAKLDIFGKNIGTIDAYFTESQINVDRFFLSLGVVDVEFNSLKFNVEDFNGSGSGKVNIFGQKILDGNFQLNKGNLSLEGTLGVKVLGRDFGVNVDIDLGPTGNKIKLDVSAFGKKVTLADLNLDPFVNKFKNVGDLTSLIESVFYDNLKDAIVSVGRSILRGIGFAGYIDGATIFFDANFNAIQDAEEFFSITLPDGSFNMSFVLEKFDTNQNGKLDSSEGRIIIIDGRDISTNLPLDTPLMATPDSTVVTPLTTIIAQLVQQGTDPLQAQTQLKAALGLPDAIDLSTYDHLEAMAKNDPNGLAVYAFDILIQNTIVQVAKFLDGASQMSLAQLSEAAIAAIANRVKGGVPVDFGQLETVQTIFQDAITAASQKEPSINPVQLAAAATAASQIVVLGNQMVKDLVASGGSIGDISLEITKLQAVSVGQIAVGLPELAAGTVTVEQFLAKNTKEAILSRIAEAQVNDPSFRPIVETTVAENALVPIEPNSGNTSPATQIDTEEPNSGDTSTASQIETNISAAIEINTPKISSIDPGSPTNSLQNQLVNGNYLLTDEADSQIPLLAFNRPIFGLSGNDNLSGTDGNDTIYGNQGADTINGGNGNDNLFGGKQSDLLSGGKGDDFLSGNNANDTLSGGDGNDVMRGGKGNDVLIGGNGDDELWGDKGFDVLTGAAGRDNFVLQFTTSNPALADTILDFTAEDKIKLVGITFSQLTFESMNVMLDGATAVASTAIKSGNNYLGVVYNVNPTALNSSSFI
jgi:ELWxxDGT repeat protein